MNTLCNAGQPPVPELLHSARRARAGSPRKTVLVLALLASGAGHAVDFGPDGMFSIKGFGEISLTRANNQCPVIHPRNFGNRASGCQFDPDPDRQRIWADDVVPGRSLSAKDTVFNQVQVWLSAKHEFAGGYKLKGTLSQNWRDGVADTRGFWREKNVEVSHEDYGTLAVGHMLSRTWLFGDYPYASNLGLSSAWASTGAGYRNLTQALRYTSRTLDVANGDVVLEATYDRGNTAFTIHKPRFLEIWAHYGREGLSIDAMLQDTRNGGPSAFGAGVFKGLYYSPVADAKVGGSGQSVAVLQATYQLDPQIELSGALRHNRWSGAYAAIVVNGPPQQWNNMFNVDWGGTLNGVANPGYPASSNDVSAGARYRMDKWTFATGLVYLGKASTRNPLERGQSNSALVNTVQAEYKYDESLSFTVFAGMIHYRRQGLAPLSMPGNASLNNIDSRATKAGNWVGASAKYTF